VTEASAIADPPARQSAFIAHDARFADVGGGAPRLECVVEVDAHEGPVYAPDEHALYFTTLPRRTGAEAPFVAIKRLSLPDLEVSVLRDDANVANGMALGPDGRLVVCEQGSPSRPAGITRVDRASGAAEVVVDVWRGQRLNSPNDIAVQADGSLWFTDPSYGYLQGFRPAPEAGDYVYRFDVSRRQVCPVADSLDKPNGIALSPDERVLYVTDSGSNQEPGSYYPERPHHIKAFDVIDGRRLVNERLFAVVAPGFPDGLKVDARGRVYASFERGVVVFDPSGDLLGEIVLPGAVNFTFGGSDRDVLYITADDAIWAAQLHPQINTI
jgi:gluconolactonase